MDINKEIEKLCDTFGITGNVIYIKDVFDPKDPEIGFYKKYVRIYKCTMFFNGRCFKNCFAWESDLNSPPKFFEYLVSLLISSEYIDNTTEPFCLQPELTKHESRRIKRFLDDHYQIFINKYLECYKENN